MSHAQQDPASVSAGAERPLERAEKLAQTDAARAIEISQQSLDQALASDDLPEQAAALRVLAIARYFQADFPRALEHAVAAERLYREIGNAERQASVLSLMGAIHGSSKQLERALEVYGRALEVSRQSNTSSGEAIVLMNLGKTHYDLGDYDEAERRYQQSIARFEALIEQGERVRPDAVLFARMGIADALLRQGKTDQAIERAAAVLAAADSDSLIYQNALAILGESHLERGELAQAEDYLQRASDEATRTRRPAKQAESLDLLARLAAARGDFAQALTLQRSVNELNLDIYNERNSAELARVQARYESDLSNQQLQLQGLKLQRSRLTIIAISAVAVTALLLALIVLQLYRAKHKSNRELQILAETDPLTGLANRRTMQDFLQRIEADRRADRGDDREAGIRCSLCLIDIDNFKQVNDRFGHPVGDRLLVDLAASLSSHLREADRVARWGGEEFLIALAGRSDADAVAIAQRLCEVIALLEVDDGEGGCVTVTTSIGVAHFTPRAAADEVVRQADAALYEAKISGKNRIAVYDAQGATSHCVRDAGAPASDA